MDEGVLSKVEMDALDHVIKAGKETLELMVEDLGVASPRVLSMSRTLDKLIVLRMLAETTGKVEIRLRGRKV